MFGFRNKNRISDRIIDHPFTDYWEIFVLKHQHPVNIAIHVIGAVIYHIVMVAAVVTWNFWLLLILPVLHLTGLLGHIVFERTHIDIFDAVFTFRSARCLNKMMYRVLTGTYHEDIAQMHRRLKEYQEAKG